jgi:hypothetical protein
MPLTYSDGTQFTGGKTLATGTLAWLDTDGDGYLSDDEKDVDQDYLTNFEETHGPLSGPNWWNQWIAEDRNKCNSSYIESEYPGPKYEGLDFTNPDTDGDGVVDGRDDTDHDGYSNWFEAWRPGMVAARASQSTGVFSGHWCQTYVSTAHSGDPAPAATPTVNALARVQPFNPCKPTYSEYCHRYPPFGDYEPTEDWQSPVRGTLPLPAHTEPWDQ